MLTVLDVDRGSAIAGLRDVLIRFARKDRSTCRIMAECRLFCRGFASLSDDQLRSRYGWLSERPDESRAVLERQADWWEMTRQQSEDAVLACDLNVTITGSCRGWNEFSNLDLERFYRELLQMDIHISD